jgi:alkanesulfonate monooxygenase SsuD/methylene tetrahydromethanopterin reductase-like flavin-dependent oxidoreductase (luciferase family)
MEEVELADQLGLDVFAIGEHHRPDFLVSSPATVLAAAAVRTERIRLSSAVTVLSSDDPVRVFQQFAHVDLLSGGRAEIMAGRGSFIESFPLFGYDLDDYDELFAEKLDLLLKIRESERVTWSGRHRPALEDAGVWPRPAPGSAARVGRGRRLAAVGRPRRSAGPAADDRDHRRDLRALRAAGRALPRGVRGRGHEPAAARVAINTHAFVGETTAAADSAFAASYLR